MSEEDQAYRDTIQHLPDQEVQRIAASAPDDYRPEAIACAQSVLHARGVDPLPRALVKPAAVVQNTALPKVAMTILGAVVLMAGFRYGIEFFFKSPISDSKAGTSAVALFVWAMFGGITQLIRRDAKPSFRDRIHWLLFLLAAIIFTIVAVSKFMPSRP